MTARQPESQTNGLRDLNEAQTVNLRAGNKAIQIIVGRLQKNTFPYLELQKEGVGQPLLLTYKSFHLKKSKLTIHTI